MSGAPWRPALSPDRVLNPRRRGRVTTGVQPFRRSVGLQGCFDGKPREKHGVIEVEILSLAFKFQASISSIRTEQF